MSNRLSAYWNQLIAKKTFMRLVILTLAILTVILLLKSCWDTDTLWLVATGREILENGIPYENPFNAYEGLSIVVQQWLFCVIVALFDQLGYIGYLLFGILNVLLLGAVTWWYLSRYNQNKFLRFGSVFLLILFFHNSLATPRPEAVTIVLLLTECMALEEYHAFHKSGWLILLSVTMVLEANLHGSMIWFHYAVLAAYVTPAIKRSFYVSNGILEAPKKSLTLWSLSMVPAMFLNPYGTDGVFYLFNSIRAGTFDYIEIIETAEPELVSITALMIVSGIGLAFFTYKTARLYSHQVYMLLGFSVLSCFMVRNVMFLYVSLVLLLPPFLDKLESMPLDLEKDLKRYLIPLFSIVILYCGGYAGSLIKDLIQNGQQELYVTAAEEVVLDEALSDMYEYMRDTSEKEVSEIVLFAGFNTGAYFEYVGFQHVFMDARPELLMKAVNQSADLLPAYQALMLGYSYSYPYEDTVGESIQKCLTYYGFDYLVVEKSLETQLMNYLDTAGEESGYVKVMESDDRILYERAEQ